MRMSLGDIADFINGYSFKQTDWNNSGIPIIRIQNLTDASKPFNRTTLNTHKKYIVEKGDILVSWSATLGVFEWNKDKALLNQHIFKVIPNSQIIDKKYLLYSLKNALREMNKHLHGATMRHINRKEFIDTKINVPSLDEQRRIVKILDNIQNLELVNKRLIQINDELSNSLFDEMFGEPSTNPRGWIKLKLEEITLKITDGEHINPLFKSKGMPIVMAGNVLENSIDFKNTKFVEEETGKKFQKKCWPQKSDVLLVSRGATIGRLCLVETTQDFCLMGSVILIKINPDIINPIFLSQLLKQSTMRRILFKTSGSSAQQAIYLKDLKKLSCIIPPIKTQNLFAKRLNSITKLKSRQNIRSIKVNQTFKSVISKL